MLASFDRSATPWLTKATCPCKTTLWHCGCVTQPPISIYIDILACTQSETHVPSSGAVYGLLQ